MRRGVSAADSKADDIYVPARIVLGQVREGCEIAGPGVSRRCGHANAERFLEPGLFVPSVTEKHEPSTRGVQECSSLEVGRWGDRKKREERGPSLQFVESFSGLYNFLSLGSIARQFTTN
jgi:hypothetical protein